MLKAFASRALINSNISSIGSLQISRTIKTQNIPKVSNEDFELIYKLPFIRHATVLNKLKILQGIVTMVSVPGCAILQQLNYASLDHLYVISSVGKHNLMKNQYI